MTKIKVENECSRCPRKQERIVTLEELVEEAKSGDKPKHPALQISLDGAKAAEFKFLCDNCRDIVLGYISNATTHREKVSAKRVVGKKKSEAVEVPPVQVLPPQQQPKPGTPPPTVPPRPSVPTQAPRR